MGRNYRTSAGTFVDNVIFQAPHQLMATAIQAQDKNFEDTVKPLEGTEVLYDNLEFVDKDGGARQQKIKDINDKITSLSEEALKNPALARGLKSQIDKFRRDLEYDVKTGDFSKMNKAATTRKALIAQINSRKDISEDGRIEALKKIDRDYQGFDKGAFTDDISIYDEIDEMQFVKDFKQSINLDSEGTTTTKPDGAGYMIKRGEVKTYITRDRLKANLDNDPTVAKWKAEKEQVLQRQLERGVFSSQEEMEKNLASKVEAFKESVIGKLKFEQINVTNEMSADSTLLQRESMAENKRQFNIRQLEQSGENFLAEISGDVEELGDSEIEDIVGSKTTEVTTQSYEELLGMQYSGAKGGKVNKKNVEMSVAQKRKFVKDEQSALLGMLELNGDGMEDFRNKMKTPQGRSELRRITGMTEESLSRQANYNKSFKYSTPVIPDYNAEDSEKVRQQKLFIGAKLSNVNQLPASTVAEFIVTKNGVTTTKRMSFAEAYKDQSFGTTLLKGPQTEGSKKVPLTNAAGIYMSVSGNRLMHPIGENYPEETPYTLKEAIDSRELDYKDQKITVLDNSKGVLDVKVNELFESKETKYDGFKSLPENFSVVQKQVIDEQGNLITVHIKINNNQIKTQILK
jgi:hypothetical protein